MSIRAVAQSLLALVAAATMVIVAAPASAGPPPDPGLARVDSGWLRGTVARDHVKFSGIPYAAPPVGERRWRPPARPPGWTGVREATTPGTPCPQFGPAGIVGAEDCLYLDVTLPRDHRPGQRLPVLVWLHGGGFVSGAAQEYDGARLAVAGGLMVVTVNYRLGPLGFLASPELAAGGGNYGLMDQTAALRWVRRNAASFGGDPANVTLAGQSAGAISVCAHLAAPASRGLFHRAIAQSGACDNELPELAAAQAFGTWATGELGCAAATDIAACLRARTPAELLTTLPLVRQAVTDRLSNQPWAPVAASRMLPRQPGEALRDGLAARVPLLIGGTHDETRPFVLDLAALTAAEYDAMLTEAFGGDAPAVLAEYPAADDASPALALSTVLTDWGGFLGACPMLRTAVHAADHQAVYAYEFAEDSGQVIDGYPMGSYHGLDLPYVWEVNLAWDPYPDLTPEQVRLAETIVRYWSAFARTGDPNGPGQPRWSQFDPAGTVVGLSTGGIAPIAFADDHRCGFWSTVATEGESRHT